MHKKTLVVVFIIASLVSVTAGTQVVEVAKAILPPLPELPTPIYIRNDSSIEPSSAPIVRVGDTFKLTENVNQMIEIERDNIVFDGNSFTITKPQVTLTNQQAAIGWAASIELSGRHNVTIRNVVFNGSISGVNAEESSNITVIQNTFTRSRYPIVFWNCQNSKIVGNFIFENSFGIFFLEDASYIDIKNNHITGCANHPIWGRISNSKIVGNNITENDGIALYKIGSDNLIQNNNFINNKMGQFNGWEPNTFDDGVNGNYWSDYNGTDSNGDGIGDTPYIIHQSNKDNHPLINPVDIEVIPEFSSLFVFPLFFVVSFVVVVVKGKVFRPT